MGIYGYSAAPPSLDKSRKLFQVRTVLDAALQLLFLSPTTIVSQCLQEFAARSPRACRMWPTVEEGSFTVHLARPGDGRCQRVPAPFNRGEAIGYIIPPSGTPINVGWRHRLSSMQGEMCLTGFESCTRPWIRLKIQPRNSSV